MSTKRISQKFVTWEWQINEVDQYGDIVECDHVDATDKNAVEQINATEWKNNVELLVRYYCNKTGASFHQYISAEQKNVYIGSTGFYTYTTTIPNKIMKDWKRIK